jgi:uncharacterized protein (TIGR02145 family)
MQNYNCSNLDNIGDIAVLTDNRDDQNYRVRKMEDGRCWMIDNLKLAGGVALDSTNTDLDASAASAFDEAWAAISDPVQSNGVSHQNGRCLSVLGDTDLGFASNTTNGALTCNGGTSTSDQSDLNYSYIAYSDPAQATNYAAWVCNNQIMINRESLTNCGYLYNWYTATAGSGKYSTPTSVTASICPAGWHLPYDTNINDFGVLNGDMIRNPSDPLYNTEDTTNNSQTRPNWRYNGKWQGSLSGTYRTVFVDQGLYGHYWSARASGVASAYLLYFDYSSVNTGVYTNYKYSGLAVRCVL